MSEHVRRERVPLAGTVDFTIMYAAHDAFTRDLQRLSAACARGPATMPATLAGWATFKHQLHVHHTAEDAALWPALRGAVAAPDERGVLEDMEREHAALEPLLDRVDGALESHEAATLPETVRALADGLGTHMRHEEDEALPLVETYLGPAGWAAFGRQIRKTQGLRGGAEFFPWLLDDAPDSTRGRVLGMLPPPVRLLYRRVWVPRYRRVARWDD